MLIPYIKNDKNLIKLFVKVLHKLNINTINTEFLLLYHKKTRQLYFNSSNIAKAWKIKENYEITIRFSVFVV